MTQLDRIEDRLGDVDSRTRAIETQLAELRGERRAKSGLQRVISALIAAVAGGLAGQIHLPGVH